MLQLLLMKSLATELKKGSVHTKCDPRDPGTKDFSRPEVSYQVSWPNSPTQLPHLQLPTSSSPLLPYNLSWVITCYWTKPLAPFAVQNYTLKGHGNEAEFLGFLQKSVRHRSLTLHFEPFRFWLRIRGDIRNRKTTPLLAESGSRQECI